MAHIDHVIDTEKLSSIIAREFAIYRTDVGAEGVNFYVTVPSDLKSMEESFERVRKTLMNEGYIPYLTRSQGEFLIIVGPKPEINVKSKSVNLLMFIATLVSTIAAGALLWAEYVNPNVDLSMDIFGIAWTQPSNWFYGAIFFALPLMLILGIHETGHYLMAKRHYVSASLPFFIPAPPPIFMLGTFGAFISMRDPMPNRKALVEIGIAGPIAGFLVAVPVTLAGLFLTNAYNITANPTGEVIFLGTPPLFAMLEAIVPVKENISMHPTAFAGWVGLFVTFLNLLPAGQLDGGHIARAVLGEKARYVSYGVVIFLFSMTLFFNSPTWIVFAILIIFLGMKHPPSLNELSTLGKRQKALAFAALSMFVLCFTPNPFVVEYIEPEVDSVISNQSAQMGYLCPNQSAEFEVIVENLGNTGQEINLDSSYIEVWASRGVDQGNETALGPNDTALERMGIKGSMPYINAKAGWQEALAQGYESTDNTSYQIRTEPVRTPLKKGESKSLLMNVGRPPSAKHGDSLLINVTISANGKLVESYVFMAVNVNYTYQPPSREITLRADNVVRTMFSINNVTNISGIDLKTTTNSSRVVQGEPRLDELFNGTTNKWRIFITSKFEENDLAGIIYAASPGETSASSFKIYLRPRVMHSPIKTSDPMVYISLWASYNPFSVIIVNYG